MLHYKTHCAVIAQESCMRSPYWLVLSLTRVTARWPSLTLSHISYTHPSLVLSLNLDSSTHCSLAHSFTHLRTHSLAHSLTHSLNHSPTPALAHPPLVCVHVRLWVPPQTRHRPLRADDNSNDRDTRKVSQQGGQQVQGIEVRKVLVGFSCGR